MAVVRTCILRSLNLSFSLSRSLLLIPLWSIGHPWIALFYFSFLILRQSVGILGRGISLSQGRYLYKQNKHRQTSMTLVGFEPTIPAFGKTKTFHTLDPRCHCDRQRRRKRFCNFVCYWIFKKLRFFYLLHSLDCRTKIWQWRESVWWR
jgi:hypothetical protein